MTNIIQPNQVTNARYDFSSVQKNLIYRVLGELQPLMSKKTIEEKEHLFKFKLKDLAKSNNYDDFITEAKKVIQKPVEYYYSIVGENGKERKWHVLTSLISGIKHELNSEYITIKIPSDAIPFFCYYGLMGFTHLNQTIAITLKSMYSKRLYELCCRWKDKGGFVMPIDELRSVLMLENKYKLMGHFKSRILNTAQKELKEKADLWFEYDLKKVDSRSYNVVSFKIHHNSSEALKDGQKGDQGEKYSFVWRFLQYSFSSNQSDKANVIADQIANNGQLDIAYDRFVRLDDELTQGKKEKTDLIRITKFFLKEDLNIKY